MLKSLIQKIFSLIESKISFKIIAIYSIITIVLIFVSGNIAYRYLRKEIREEEVNSLHKIALNINQLMEEELESAKVALSPIKMDPYAGKFLFEQNRNFLKNHFFATWRDWNYYFNQFNFYLPDGVTFIRFQNLNLYGDLAVKKRKMIADILKNKKDFNSKIVVGLDETTITGLEEGLTGVSFRAVAPIFYKNKLSGLCEVGKSFDKNFLKKLNYIAPGYYYIYRFEDLNFKKSVFVDYLGVKDTFFVPDKTLEGVLGDKFEVIRTKDKLYAILLIPYKNYSGEVIGYIKYVYDRNELINQLNSNILVLVVPQVLFLILFVIVLFVFIDKTIIKRLKIISDNIENFGEGDITNVKILDIKSKDEIGQIAKIYNKMVENIKNSIQKEKSFSQNLISKQEQIENLNEQRNIFLATLTHDLKSPILAEQKALEFMLSRSPESPLGEILEYLDDIYKTNDELLRIVTNILAVHHYESGQLLLNMEKSSIKEVINKSILPMKHLARDCNCEIIVFIEENLPDIVMDKAEIYRVITNLLNNAIKHNIKNVKIEISAVKIDNNIQISVKDNGKGIEEKEREHIFQRYPTKKRSVATGLGLYLSKQIIDAHNGQIGFETEVNKGTTFYFTLPIK